MKLYQVTDNNGRFIGHVTASTHAAAARATTARHSRVEEGLTPASGYVTNVDENHGHHFIINGRDQIVVTDAELATDTRPEPELGEGDDDDAFDSHTAGERRAPIHAKPLMPAEPVSPSVAPIGPGERHGVVIRPAQRRKWRQTGRHFTVVKRVTEGQYAGKFELRYDTGETTYETLVELAGRSVPATDALGVPLDERPTFGSRAHMDPLSAAHRLADVVSHELTQFTDHDSEIAAALRAALADFREATR